MTVQWLKYMIFGFSTWFTIYYHRHSIDRSALVSAILEQERWFTAALMLVSSLLAIIYVGRIIGIVLLSKRPRGVPQVGEAPAWMVAPTLVLALLNLYFGIASDTSSELALRAAQALEEVAR